MKKFFITLSFLLAFTLTLAGCANQIPTKPEDSTLEFWITQDVSDFDFSEHYEVSGWFGARQFYGKGYLPESINDEGIAVEPEHCVKYLVGAYPDESDGGSYIVRIDITDPTVTVYGINCGSSAAEFENALAEHGYTLQQNDDRLQAVYGKVRITLTHNRLSIAVEVTNKKGIQY